MNSVSLHDHPIDVRLSDARPDDMTRAVREYERGLLGWAVELRDPIGTDGTVSPDDQWLLAQLVGQGKAFQTTWCAMTSGGANVRLMWHPDGVHLEVRHDRGLAPDIVENAVVSFCALHAPAEAPADPALVPLGDPSHAAYRATIERVTNRAYERLVRNGTDIPTVTRSASMPPATLRHVLVTVARLAAEAAREHDGHRQYVTRQTFKIVAHLWDQTGAL